MRSYITGHETKLEVLEKLNEEDQSLKQKIQDLESKNATLKNKLDKTETKAKALLEKTQKELEESKSCIAVHETKLKQFNKENESLRQEIKNLKNENTTLKGELGKTKTKTNEVSLEKVEKRQFSPKVACASLAAMLAVGVLNKTCQRHTAAVSLSIDSANKQRDDDNVALRHTVTVSHIDPANK